MARIFFDTEFYENGTTIELISIGMVREDGATYYAQTLGAASLAQADNWLRANVLPHLGRGAGRERNKIAAEIVDFAGPNPEFWAYYADYDWVVLCQLFGRMIELPKGWPMYCRDLKQEADRLDVRFPEQTAKVHSALHDAIWARDMYLQFIGGK